MKLEMLVEVVQWRRPSGWPWLRGLGWKPQTGKDVFNDDRIFNAGNDSQFTSATVASLKIDVKGTLFILHLPQWN